VSDSVNLDDLELDNAPSYGAVLGWNFAENGQLEGSWSRESTEMTVRDGISGQRQPLGDVVLDTYMVSALYRFGRFYDGIRPWLGLGLGTTVLGADSGDSSNKFAFGLSFGTHFAFDRRWAVRTQARFITTYIDEKDAVFCSYGCWTGTTKSYVRQFDIAAGLTLRL
jgi:opacity protein-like surface antigen